MKRPIALLVTDTHGSFSLLERIITTVTKLYPPIEFIFHTGDIGAYDEKSIERISPKEKKLMIHHNNPMNEFIPYIKKEKRLLLPMYHIPGNHEDFIFYEKLNDPLKYNLKNWIPIHPDFLYSRIIKNQIITFVGIGKINPRKHNQVNPCQCKYLSKNEIFRFHTMLSTNKKNINVMLFHEPPLIYKCDRHCDFGHPEFSNIVKKFHPNIIIAGHMHFSYYTEISKTKIYGIPAAKNGYFGILYNNLDVSLRQIENPQKELFFNQYPIGNEEKFFEKLYKKNKKTLSGKKIIKHFNLKIKEYPTISGHIGKIISIIRKKEMEDDNFNYFKAINIAENYLRKNKIINSDSHN